MANNELQPPFYQELFDGFSGIALERGVKSLQRDSALEPGKDGSLTPTGEPAWHYTFTIDSGSMPPSLMEEYSNVEISHVAENIFDASISPEAVLVYLDLKDKTRKTYDLRKRLGNVAIYLNENIHAEDIRPQTFDVAEEVQDEILDELLHGDASLLLGEGPKSEFARAVHLKFNEPDEVTPDDIDELRRILSALRG